jgi:SAM-dependent methyltransferase
MQSGTPQWSLPLTGERTVPGVPEENYWFRRHEAAYRLAARLARGRIIDAGSGEGYGAAMLARRGAAVGVELDAATVAHAARRYRTVTFVRGDLCRFPLASGSVDAVVVLQVLEHLVCPREFLERCRDALVSGGVLVISTPNRRTFPAGLNPSHVHEYDAAELRGLLRSSVGEPRILGLKHGATLSALDRLAGEPIPDLLVRAGYQRLPRWLRLALRTVRARHFRPGGDPDGSLDLIAACRVP